MLKSSSAAPAVPEVSDWKISDKCCVCICVCGLEHTMKGDAALSDFTADDLAMNSDLGVRQKW